MEAETLAGLPASDPAFDPLPDWLDALIEGQACTDWVRINWGRAASVEGAWFDKAKADAVVALWPRVFRLTSNRFAGYPFRLSWWQEIIVRLMVGWKKPVQEFDPATGQLGTFQVRVFRELYLWVPRKNGKSEFLAALALLFWALDGVQGGEGYLYARDEDQALLAFNKMREMVKLMPAADAARFNVYTKSIYCPKLAASFMVLTGAEGGKHGSAPYVRFGDEMHEWRSRVIDDTTRQGSSAYLQPVGLKASTAGLKSNLVGMELWNFTRDVLSGAVNDPTVLAVMFAAEEGDDWQAETTWRKANPNLQVSLTLDDFRIEAEKAKQSRTAEANFRAYKLNQWVEGHVRWLNMNAWDKAAAEKDWDTRRARLKGRKCWAGFDLSKSQDATSLVWLFEPETPDGRWELLCDFWLPKTRIATAERLLKMRLESFVEAGAITVVDDEVVDQRLVLKALLDGMRDFDVQDIGHDDWQAAMLQTELQHSGVDADDLTPVRMGYHSLAAPSQKFENLVLSSQLDHGGHPVLRWMASNAVVRFDENMNFMPAKKRSPEMIDGIMAAVIALAVSMAVAEEKPVPGIVVLD